MHEDIITFYPTQGPYLPFHISMSGVSYCDGSYKIIRAKSNIYCIEYILKGKGYVRLNKTSFCASAGDIYILPAGSDHYYYSDSEEPWTKIWFNISGSLIEKILDSYKIKHVYHVEGLDLSELFEDFFETAKLEIPRDEIFDRCAGIFLRIAQRISKHINTEQDKGEITVAARLKEQIDNLTDFRLSFENMVERLYCTESHAIRAFKSGYGITPYQYLLQKKLSVAKMMLENTHMSIKEISVFLGFNDNHYFSVFFRRQTGVSPKQYRNEQINKD